MTNSLSLSLFTTTLHSSNNLIHSDIKTLLMSRMHSDPTVATLNPLSLFALSSPPATDHKLTQLALDSTRLLLIKNKVVQVSLDTPRCVLRQHAELEGALAEPRDLTSSTMRRNDPEVDKKLLQLLYDPVRTEVTVRETFIYSKNGVRPDSELSRASRRPLFTLPEQNLIAALLHLTFTSDKSRPPVDVTFEGSTYRLTYRAFCLACLHCHRAKWKRSRS